MFAQFTLGFLNIEFANAAGSWDNVQQILEVGVRDHVFPGAVAIVGNKDGILFQTAVGSQTNGQKTPLGDEKQTFIGGWYNI